jgi:hypothetical protein
MAFIPAAPTCVAASAKRKAGIQDIPFSSGFSHLASAWTGHAEITPGSGKEMFSF